MLIRFGTVLICFLREAVLLLFCGGGCLLGLTRPKHTSLLEHRLPIACERLGGAFPKLGQILSTRADLLPDDICRGLSRLQDKVAPIAGSVITKIVQAEYKSTPFHEFDPVPFAAATIAQVHRAIRADDGREIAVKVMRPDVQQILMTDCSCFRAAGRVIGLLPQMRGVPVNEALIDTGEILVLQTDLERELLNLERLGQIFADSDCVHVPAVHRDLCTQKILCMDYIPGLRKITDKDMPERQAEEALTIGVRALFKMIFEIGFIHCDMHPGNILVAPDRRLVILDAGFMTELGTSTRRSFAEFFLAFALRDGQSAAKIVRETAARLPENLDVNAFDSNVSSLVERFGGLRARDFRVAGFVSELFAIQRRYGIYGTSKFTLAILSLLVFEGVAKQRFPDLDFQREAIPFLMTALK